MHLDVQMSDVTALAKLMTVVVGPCQPLDKHLARS
jgi:hypothetical protein